MAMNNPDSTAIRIDLAAVVSGVLENLAFMVNDDCSAPASSETTWLECQISYSGPATGVLHCWCTRNFAIQLTANLLGTNPSDAAAEDQMEDALGEFMNVVCGQFVTTCHGVGPVFDLSIPTAAECAAPALDLDREDAACELSVSNEPFYCLYRAGASS